MRDDGKGITVNPTNGSKVFYASGQRGKAVRANGRGSALDRGYYHMFGNIGDRDADIKGPFSSRDIATF